MGAGFGPAFVAALGQSAVKAKERQKDEEYRKALIEQAKAQAKFHESKMVQQNYEAQQMAALLNSMGQSMGMPPMPMPAVQPAPSAPAAAPEKPGLPGLLGKIFGGPKMEQQAPAPVQPAPTPPTMPAGQPGFDMTSIGMTPDVAKAYMFDVLGKKVFDVPPFLAKKQMEKGEVRGSVDLGDRVLFYNRQGEPTGMLPKAQEFDWVEQTDATGKKVKVPIPKKFSGYTGAPSPIPTEPPGAGMTSEKAGKINLVGNAMDRLMEVNELIMPKGKIDRVILGKAALGGGLGQGAALHSKMYQGIDAALRIETGAQATPHEITTKMREFWPNAWDTDEVIKGKIKDFTDYVHGAANTIDPTGELRKQRKTKPNFKSLSAPEGYRPTGRTHNGKPLFENPNAPKEQRYWTP